MPVSVWISLDGCPYLARQLDLCVPVITWHHKSILPGFRLYQLCRSVSFKETLGSYGRGICVTTRERLAVCLQTTMAAPKMASVNAAIASVASELKNRLKAFLIGNVVKVLAETDYLQTPCFCCKWKCSMVRAPWHSLAHCNPQLSSDMKSHGSFSKSDIFQFFLICCLSPPNWFIDSVIT